jgi:hypothetical protein
MTPSSTRDRRQRHEGHVGRDRTKPPGHRSSTTWSLGTGRRYATPDLERTAPIRHLTTDHEFSSCDDVGEPTMSTCGDPGHDRREGKDRIALAGIALPLEKRRQGPERRRTRVQASARTQHPRRRCSRPDATLNCSSTGTQIPATIVAAARADVAPRRSRQAAKTPVSCANRRDRGLWPCSRRWLRGTRRWRNS